MSQSIINFQSCWDVFLSSWVVHCTSTKQRFMSLASGHRIEVSTVFTHVRKFFLAHRIRISEILPWDRKYYPTHAILPRLSSEGYIHRLYWNSRTWSSCDIIVMLK